MNEQLRELQLIELEMLKEVIRICDKYCFQYVAIDGTLLGTVRHKGFIPWDDDIDIGIPRMQYEKLLPILERELPQHLKVRTDKERDSYFLQVQDIRTKVKLGFAKNDSYRHAWIDIVPLDGMPNSKIGLKIHEFRLLFNRMLVQFSVIEDMVHLSRENRPAYEKILIKLAFFLHTQKYVDNMRYKNKITKLLKKYSIDNSNWIVDFWSAYKFKELFPKNIYYPLKKMSFEDIEIYVPNDYKYVLSQLYGDYMVIPPKEKQGNQHQLKIEYIDVPKGEKNDI